MRLIIVFIAILLLAGCGPKNKTIGKDTDVRSTITIEGNTGFIVINPGINPTSGGTDLGGTENLAELTTDMADLLRLAQPGSNMAGSTQDAPVATNKVGSENTSTSTTPVPVIAPVTTTKTKVEETEVIGENNSSEIVTTGSKAYFRYLYKVPSSEDDFFQGKSVFMTCPNQKNFEGCTLSGGDNQEFEYHGIDPDTEGRARYLWLYPRELELDESSTMKCWNEYVTVEFALGSGGEGIDAIGNSWGVCD